MKKLMIGLLLVAGCGTQVSSTRSLCAFQTDDEYAFARNIVQIDRRAGVPEVQEAQDALNLCSLATNFTQCSHCLTAIVADVYAGQ